MYSNGENEKAKNTSPEFFIIKYGFAIRKDAGSEGRLVQAGPRPCQFHSFEVVI